MKAKLSNYRQSPRKVRLVADAVRGKKVDHALTTLSSMPKRAASSVSKLIKSASANAKAKGANEADLTIKKITVDPGIIFKRYRPRARGRAAQILKRTSHINLELGTNGK
ncbi:50S ribosomal protein L22 [bacterium]|jgi:large subunit ribosomal protein L22|nr:50S ribosomal protein L22 [bacterium]|tara:strand:- start:17724 stop:18053 length:330 start_codon:yes stop_codon:yes gene_type:complete